MKKGTTAAALEGLFMSAVLVMLLGLVLLWLCAGCGSQPPVDLCRPWCKRVLECNPKASESVEQCALDCDDLMKNDEVAEVTGFTRKKVQCEIDARNCKAAEACKP